jgi:hypothetical protein
MKTIIRLLCLGLCLSLAMPAVWAKAEDHQKKKSHSQSKSNAKTKSSHASDSKKSKSKGKDRHKQTGKHARTPDNEGEGASGRGAGGGDGQSNEAGRGFRGLPWGSPPGALKDLELREQSGSLKYYTVAGDDMAVLGVAMREVVYVFCKDKLAGVLTRYDGELNQLTLLEKLKGSWGTPLESPPNIKGDRSWRFDAGETSLMMEYSEEAATGALAWMAKDILAGCQPRPAE